MCWQLASRITMELAVPSWSCLQAVSKPVWHIPISVCTVKNSSRWTEELSETCTVSFQNKFENLVHLVSFIIRNCQGCAVKRSCLIAFQAFALREWRKREVWHQQFSICFTCSFLSCFVLFSGFFCSCIHVFYLFILLCFIQWLPFFVILFYILSNFLYRPFSFISSSVWSNLDNSSAQSNGYVYYFSLFASFSKDNKFLTSQWLIVFNIQNSLGRNLSGAQCNFCYCDKQKYRRMSYRRGTSAVNSC